MGWVKMLLVFFTLFSSSFTHQVLAQDEPEYRMEAGAGIGLINYLGDYNGNLLKEMQPMGGLVAKYKINPRMAWAATLNYGQLKGKSDNSNTWYPGATLPADFSTKLVDLNVKFEYNFWPFGTGREYYGAQPLTPFIYISGSDRLDGIRDPYGIKSNDLFKNTDCYSTLQLSLTYEFMEKCKTCHNDKE